MNKNVEALLYNEKKIREQVYSILQIFEKRGIDLEDNPECIINKNTFLLTYFSKENKNIKIIIQINDINTKKFNKLLKPYFTKWVILYVGVISQLESCLSPYNKYFYNEKYIPERMLYTCIAESLGENLCNLDYYIYEISSKCKKR